MDYYVWYWLGGKNQQQLKMVSCGKDSAYAWRVLESCTQVFYEPWLECKAK